MLGTWDGTSPTTTFLLTDSLGSVVSSFNNLASGAVMQGNQLYGPYGNQRLKQGSLSTSKGFTGQYILLLRHPQMMINLGRRSKTSNNDESSRTMRQGHRVLLIKEFPLRPVLMVSIQSEEYLDFGGGQGEPIEGWSATRYVNAENGAGACAEWQLCAEFTRNSNWWGANIQIDLESGGRPICTSCDPTLQRTADLTGSSINVTRITDAGDIVSKFYQPQP